MLNKTLITFVLLFLFILPGVSTASDADDAKAVANNIMTKLSQGNYKEVWDNHMSSWFKSKVTKDSFLANLSLGRSMLGKRTNSKLIDVTYAKNDPTTDYQGDVYAFTYINKYAGATLYERVVVVNEDGNGFKMAGFWANPAQ